MPAQPDQHFYLITPETLFNQQIQPVTLIRSVSLYSAVLNIYHSEHLNGYNKEISNGEYVCIHTRNRLIRFANKQHIKHIKTILKNTGVLNVKMSESGKRADYSAGNRSIQYKPFVPDNIIISRVNRTPNKTTHIQNKHTFNVHHKMFDKMFNAHIDAGDIQKPILWEQPKQTPQEYSFHNEEHKSLTQAQRRDHVLNAFYQLNFNHGIPELT